MKAKNLLTTVAVLTVAYTASASAAILRYEATLNGAQQVPNPVMTEATGSGLLEVDDVSETLTFSMSVNGIDFTDLIDVGPGAGPVHLHNAPAGSNGPVVVPFTFPGGGYTDTMDGFELERAMVSFDAISGGADFTTFISELNAGNYYINVHTADWGAGEIRGQLAAVPLPASALFLIAAIGGLAGVRRARSR